MNKSRPRIALIHALHESQAPTLDAFADIWADAATFSLIDDSLPGDLAEGVPPEQIQDRFITLARYVAATGTAERPTQGILFTCASFGPAIERVQSALDIPVLKPNEAAFEDALDAGSRIGLMVTFPRALPLLRNELETLARQRGQAIEIVPVVAEGALDALRQGDSRTHDRIAAEAAARMPPVDVLGLGQFSLARAARAIEPVPTRRVVTTPQSAVAKLKRLVDSAHV